MIDSEGYTSAFNIGMIDRLLEVLSDSPPESQMHPSTHLARACKGSELCCYLLSSLPRRASEARFEYKNSTGNTVLPYSWKDQVLFVSGIVLAFARSDYGFSPRTPDWIPGDCTHGVIATHFQQMGARTPTGYPLVLQSVLDKIVEACKVSELAHAAAHAKTPPARPSNPGRTEQLLGLPQKRPVRSPELSNVCRVGDVVTDDTFITVRHATAFQKPFVAEFRKPGSYVKSYQQGNPYVPARTQIWIPD